MLSVAKVFDSSLSEDITECEFLRKFSTPTFGYYSVVSDPIQHIRYFKDKMVVYCRNNHKCASPRNSSQAHLAQDQQINQYNIVHTLRPGKQVDNQVSMPSTPIQHNPTQASTFSSFTFSNSEKFKKDKTAN